MTLRIALGALAAVLVVVLFWFLVWQPQQDEIEALELEIEQVRSDQTQREARIATLRQVREQAAELHASIRTSEILVPNQPGVASVVRQLQLAAQESGLRITLVSTGRPQPLADVEVEEPGRVLAQMTITVQAQGTYFQVIDFLRRVEDPAITPRGTVWTQLTATVDEPPILDVVLTGEVYAVLVEADVVEEPEPEDESAEDADEGTEELDLLEDGGGEGES